ncbi:MAG: UGMP family protein, partial [Candidatus Woesearchaeota archaeon]
KIKKNIYKKEDLCYSAQETVFAMMIEVAERAMSHCNKNELLLGGGVACNKKLQEMAKTMCKERKAKLYTLPNELNVDNGAMIAWLGYLMFKSKNTTKLSEAIVKPYVRTDEIDVNWIKAKSKIKN